MTGPAERDAGDTVSAQEFADAPLHGHRISSEERLALCTAAGWPPKDSAPRTILPKSNPPVVIGHRRETTLASLNGDVLGKPLLPNVL